MSLMTVFLVFGGIVLGLAIGWAIAQRSVAAARERAGRAEARLRTFRRHPVKFELVDAVVWNREHPATTFSIPSLEKMALIGAGDFVKFGFVLPKPMANFTSERLWVKVTAVVGDTIHGAIANDPDLLEALHGDPVTGEKRHVLKIHSPPARHKRNLFGRPNPAAGAKGDPTLIEPPPEST